MSDRVIVIGGGVIGAMCAWNLTQAGCQVTVVDRGDFGAAQSFAHAKPFRLSPLRDLYVPLEVLVEKRHPHLV